ncbi:MAG TPA: CAAD domain-containing protein [Thermosynechococcaceae cyanobacterium]
MNTEINESQYLDATAPSVEVATDAPLLTTTVDEPLMLPPASEGNEQLQQVWSKVYAFLAGLPDYLSEFFGAYKRPLTTLGLLFGGIISVKLTLAILDAINDIPLLAPTFELIGIIYATWFIYRYVWKASSRYELEQDYNKLKEEVFGKRAQ